MRLQQLHYLQLVIEKGSFAAAAEAAGITQPAISMAMQRLESAWGVRLFEKVGRQKLPTRTALLAAQHAADLQPRLVNLGTQHPAPLDAWTPQRDSPVLRVGMSPAAALLYAPSIASHWHLHQPSGLLRLVSGSAAELLANLLAGALDLVIAPRPRGYHASHFGAATLYSSEPTVYARVGHPLGSADSLHVIVDAGWAVTGQSGTPGNVIEEAHRVRGLAPPKVLIQCNDYPTLLAIVSQSDLLAVVPHPALVPQAHNSNLTPLTIREGLPQYDVCAFWLAKNTSQHAQVIDDILGSLRERTH